MLVVCLDLFWTHCITSRYEYRTEFGYWDPCSLCTARFRVAVGLQMWRVVVNIFNNQQYSQQGVVLQLRAGWGG
jgi:hypothetical protein